MELRNFQDTMREIYLERDEQRGVDATFRWLTEELGELARAIRTLRRSTNARVGSSPRHTVIGGLRTTPSNGSQDASGGLTSSAFLLRSSAGEPLSKDSWPAAGELI